MQKHLLVGNGKEILLQYPENWDELSRKQAIYAGNLLYLLSTKQLEVDQFRKLMVDKFINRDNSGNDKLPSFEDKMDMWANEGQLADTVNFFFKVTREENEPEKFEMVPTGIRNLVPRFRVGLKRYYGPGDFLENMSFGQFKDGLTCAHKFMETLNPEWLTRLLAVLYLRKGERYNMKTVEKRERKFKRVNMGIKYMAFCYLMGCMHNLRTDGDGEGIEVDGNRCKFSLIFKNDGSGGDDDGVGLIGVVMTLAESGVFGNIQQTTDADAIDVITRLYQLKLEEINFKKRNKDG